MKLLNIGCGSLFHPEWINIDLVSNSPHVRAYDIRKGLPYHDNTFDACYSSHIIEHLDQTEARKLVTECFRVIRPGGIIRVVVPDLEAIAKNYLNTLERLDSGEVDADADYDWMMIELYDQVVRNQGGGMMSRYLRDPNCKNKDFIFKRIGLQTEPFWSDAVPAKRSLLTKIRSKTPLWFLEMFRVILAKSLIILILGKKGKCSFEEGLFRNSGEVHRWMYDRFSMARLLRNSGFGDIQNCRADESRIEKFNNYNLDTIGKEVCKPNSLFMEGIKPVGMKTLS